MPHFPNITIKSNNLLLHAKVMVYIKCMRDSYGPESLYEFVYEDKSTLLQLCRPRKRSVPGFLEVV